MDQHFIADHPLVKLADFGAEHADFGTEHADFGAELADFGAEHADFGAEHADFGAKLADFGAEHADFGADAADFGERVVAEVTDLIAHSSEFLTHSSEFLIHTLESSPHAIVQPINCSQLNADHCGDSDDACPADALLQCGTSRGFPLSRSVGNLDNFVDKILERLGSLGIHAACYKLIHRRSRSIGHDRMIGDGRQEFKKKSACPPSSGMLAPCPSRSRPDFPQDGARRRLRLVLHRPSRAESDLIAETTCLISKLSAAEREAEPDTRKRLTPRPESDKENPLSQGHPHARALAELVRTLEMPATICVSINRTGVQRRKFILAALLDCRI